MIATTEDECPLCRSLFEEPTGCPWRDLLQPALLRVATLVDERLRVPDPDPEGQAVRQAVGARALLALDRTQEARQLLDLALATDVREAHAVEALVGSAPLASVVRLWRTGTPGQRADGACDGVLASLRAGDPVQARSWVGRALAVCPDHAEAERWQAYLDGASEHAVALLWSVDHQPVSIESLLAEGRATDPLLGHLADLLPRPWDGLLSRERMLRRHRSLQRERPAAAGTGLARLRECGRVGRWLDRDQAYASLGADDPAVLAELALDRARACVDQGRSAWAAAQACWRLTPALGLFQRSRLTQCLALLALRDPRLAGIADHATALALEELPRDPDVVAARAAALVVCDRPAEASPLARRALRVERGSSLGVVLAIEALRRTGADRAVRRALRQRAQHPDHGWLADVWLMDPSVPPLEGEVFDLEDRWDGEREGGENPSRL